MRVAEGTAAESEARAILRPLQVAPARDAARNPQEHLSQQVRVNDRGFFHFDGVAPGSYQLDVHLAGYAMVRQPPIEVIERTEAELRDIVPLFIPKALEVTIDPPMDLDGKSWRVELIPLASPAAPLDFLAEAAAEGGRWRRGALAPGQYHLMVRDSQRALWYHEIFEHDNEDHELQVLLPLVPVTGTVNLGGEPLAAKLSFGKDGRSVPLASDADGHFEGHLTALGTWKVKVEAEQPTVRRWLEVSVEKADGQSQARIDLDLPDGTIRGVVVDEQGDSARPPTTVYAMLVDEASPGVSSYVDRQGRFEFRGLAEGRVELTAEAPGDLTSVPILADVRKFAAQEPVRLVLRKRAHVFGQVTADGSPVPGARVELVPEGPTAADIEDVVTGVDGWFQTDLTPGSREVFVRVFAPGYALRVLRAPLVEGQPLDIPVDRLGGNLILTVGTEAAPGDWHADRAVLWKDGQPLTLSALRSWASLHGVVSTPDSLQVPHVEAGTYQLCKVPAQYLSHGEQDHWRCVEGDLPPLGDLVLALPATTQLEP